MKTFLDEPTIRFCEANIAGPIAQPANAISALVISLVGYFILKRKAHQFSRWLGGSAVIIGITSFINHATFTFFGQLLDLGSMFLLVSFIILAALRRPKVRPETAFIILFTGTVIPLLLTAVFQTIG